MCIIVEFLHYQIWFAFAQGWCKQHPSPRNAFKIDVDAAIDKQNQLVRLGVVIRDSNSKIIGTAVKTSQLWKDVAYAEAEAMKWGLEVAKEVADLVNNKK